MGLFEELCAPVRFNSLRKYFHGLEMSDLDPDYPYVDLVETKDKLRMLVFCNKYICTPDHKYIRRVLDQEDLGEENLEHTIKILETMVRQKGDELEKIRGELDDATNKIHDLQYDKAVLENKN